MAPLTAAAVAAIAAGAAMMSFPGAAGAQATGHPLSSRPGSLYRQGLPPATMFDSTGRSPGSLSPRVTTRPTAPYVIPPVSPNTYELQWGKRVPPPRTRITD